MALIDVAKNYTAPGTGFASQLCWPCLCIRARVK